MNFKLFSVVVIVIQILAICTIIVETRNDILNTYKSAECQGKSRCIPAVFRYLHTQSNDEFLNSERANHFKELIGENQPDATKRFNEKYFVYSILDSSLAKSIVESIESSSSENEKDQFSEVFNNNNYKRIEQLFAYVGSGGYTRHHQHLFYSKAMCPENDKVFVHSRVSPTTMYICSSVFSSQTFEQNNEVFVYQIMAVKDSQTARKLESALIFTLYDVLVNYNIALKDDENERHFLAHFAIESTFRFLKDDFKHVKYDFRAIPLFPLHNMISYGHYGTDTISPNKLVYQRNCFHQYQTRRFAFSTGQLVDYITPYVFLPFGETGFDYNLPNGKTQRDVQNELDKLVKLSFKHNEPEMLKCYEKERDLISENIKMLLQSYIGELYYILHACAETIDSDGKKDSNINAELFRRIRAKFEHLILTSLYVDNEDNDNIYIKWNSEQSNNINNIPFPNQKLPENLAESCRETELFTVQTELQERIEEFEETAEDEINELELESDSDNGDADDIIEVAPKSTSSTADGVGCDDDLIYINDEDDDTQNSKAPKFEALVSDTCNFEFDDDTCSLNEKKRSFWQTI